MSKQIRPILLILALVASLFTPACKRGKILNREYMYVAAPQVNIRDRLAAVYNKVAVLNNGAKVEVIERQKRFVHVRVNGQEGWVEARYLVDQDIYDGFAGLAKDNAKTKPIGRGVTRAELNIHLEPARDSEHLYQLKETEKIEILKRAVAEKPNPEALAMALAKAAAAKSAGKNVTPPKDAKAAAPQDGSKTKAGKLATTSGASTGKQAAAVTAAAATKASSNTPAAAAPPDVPKTYEDWWLVRNAEGHTGWVLARMIDLDVPLEIAQYAEGRRIVGSLVINTVADEEKGNVPQYLVLTSEPKDGQPFDFSQIRVFSWNVKRHRYETAYRERDIFGVFPAAVGTGDFGAEGTLPFFTVRMKNDQGQEFENKYKMNGPIVRRVLSPAEQAAEDARKAQAIAERKQRLAELRAARAAAAPKRRAGPVKTARSVKRRHR